MQCRWAQRSRGECDNVCLRLLPAVLNESSVSSYIVVFFKIPIAANFHVANKTNLH